MNRILPFLLLFSISLQAQDLLHCGADEMRIETLHANPKIAEAVIKRDAELEAFTREYALREPFDKLRVTPQGTTLREPFDRLRVTPQGTRGGQIYTIPVVFHVIHKYGDENISREQMLDGLEVLNATFRKQIPDTADIHPDFKPIHADCEIEFALATKDPEGNCHSGINRIASTLTNSGDHRVKDLIHWNPSMYLNVYIVSNAAGLAGHAVWPADADTIPAWDGIVMGHNYMGRIGTSDQTRSVVFAHELGHYLNLHHIWGGNNVPDFYYLPVGQAANCNEDDQVADTPNTIGWSSCNLNASSCGNVRDNVQNAMDYSYCNLMFTEGQKARMRACLNATIANRNNLWTATNLAATGVTPSAGLCAANFMADKQVVCSNFENEITFTEMAYHGTVDSLSWVFENGTPSASSAVTPTVAYTEPGTHDVSLMVYKNGQSAEVTKEGFVTVLQDSSFGYPFWDWFESGRALNTYSWMEYSYDDVSRWTLTDAGYHSSAHSVMVDNWTTDLLTIDELYSPIIDVSNTNQMRLAFKYAFASKETNTSATKLQVQVRKDCESNWSTRLNIIGQNLETAPIQETPFEPQTETLWQQEDINLPSTYLTEDFQFRFVFTSEGRNRLFIDDVNVDLTAGINDYQLFNELTVFPNPTEDVVDVRFELLEATGVQVSVVDLLGRTLQTHRHQLPNGKQRLQLNLAHLSSGLYSLVLSTEYHQIQKKIIVY